MDQSTEFRWKDVRQPKSSWAFAAAIAVGAVIMDRIFFDTPTWLLCVWIAIFLVSSLFFDWIRAAKARTVLALCVYAGALVLSGVVVFDPLGYRRPLAVQEIGQFGVFVPRPAEDPLVSRVADWNHFPLYASAIYLVTNESDKPITFQAILKIEAEGKDLVAAMALGERNGLAEPLKAKFDAMFFRERTSYLLSPVTIGANSSVRGRFLFHGPPISEKFKDQLDLWTAALDLQAKLNGVAYIDLRSLEGKRLAEPTYLLGKGP